MVKSRNANFKRAQEAAFAVYFDTVERSPLTEEQRAACICMDDNLLIVASAGSGKTATMVAKAGYVMSAGLAKPNEILLLAFNRDAAEELGSRVAERLSPVPGVESIRSQTFSAFGLHVVATATGKKPTLAPWLCEGGGKELAALLDIVRALSSSDPKFRRDWETFRTVYAADIGRLDEPGVPDAYADGRKGYRTASGEIVKSKEERAIADWLFYQGVSYVYERPYEHDTATVEHGQYHPDFYYPDVGLYHEHFAIDGKGQSPFGAQYLDGVRWKRQLHKEKGTALFETTSFGIREGTDFESLENKLRETGAPFKPDPSRQGEGSKPLRDEDLAKIIRVFQQHVKNNGLSPEALEENANKLARKGYKDRLFRFLRLYQKISAEWERRLVLGGYLDFEDMLLQASELIETGRFQSPYTVILADEFQDSSRGRMRLLKAMTRAAPRRAHLCVVGDDWQSINRFAGADISVMTHFQTTFSDASQLTLTKTFRCPEAICSASGRFVQKNPDQIRKTVQTTSKVARNVLKAYAFDEISSIPPFIGDQLKRLHTWIGEGKVVGAHGGRVSAMILGRYRSDRPKMLDDWARSVADRIDLSYYTIHASKGLEAEYVFLLNLVEGRRGFPSQMDDDPLLQMAMPAPESYPMAEERRLFYVALTRASKQVRMFTTVENPSRFVIELVSAGDVEIIGVDGAVIEHCPRCHNGTLKMREGKFGRFQGCSLFPRCDFTRRVVEEVSSSLPAQHPATQ